MGYISNPIGMRLGYNRVWPVKGVSVHQYGFD